MLLLVPKIFPYSATIGNDVNVIAMASGMPRRRRCRIGATHKAKLEFSLTSEHYDYLMSFWRLTRDKTFACRMFSESSHLQWHRVQWANAPSIINHGGGVFTFACDVVTAKPIDKDKITPPPNQCENGYRLIKTYWQIYGSSIKYDTEAEARAGLRERNPKLDHLPIIESHLADGSIWRLSLGNTDVDYHEKYARCKI